MSSKKRDACLYCTAFVILIVSTFLIAFSFSITEIDEVALTKHTRSQELSFNEDYAKPGRHFTGLFQELVTFKRNRILINFADDSSSPNETKNEDIVSAGGNTLSCWTKDGSNVYIDLSFYFTLVPEKLLAFYNDYGDKWLDFVVRLSYSGIKETTVEYITTDFFTERNAIQVQLIQNLQASFDKFFSGAVKVEGLQLRRIDFDDDFESATVSKLIQLQSKKSFENKKEVAIVKKETERDVAIKQNLINEKLAEGTAAGIVIKEQLWAVAYKDMVGSFSATYRLMLDQAVIGSAADYKKYIYAMELGLIKDYEVIMVDPNQKKFISV